LLHSFIHLGFSQIIVFGGFFTGVYYFVSYDDGTSKKQAIEQSQTEMSKTSNTLKQKQIDLENLKEFEKKINNEKEVIKRFLDYIPNSLTYQDFSALLNSEARSSGVNIVEKKDRPIQKKDKSEYDILKIQFKVSGAFTQILVFLSRLTAQKRMLIVNDMEMKSSRDSQIIEAQISISAYRYVEPVETDKN